MGNKEQFSSVDNVLLVRMWKLLAGVAVREENWREEGCEMRCKAGGEGEDK